MSQDVVLDTQGDRPDETAGKVRTAPSAPSSVDPVRALTESIQRPGGLMYRVPGTRTKRPFDAQYWACWVVALVYPVLMAYLWITR
ncbi:hypothetical protein SAMN04488543_4167 [Friedmanniella luteola]|uniref:Uncharacterized protein n=1 Tax=Friedmanniella luteola TaxID=546871 RepID=A0A1H2A2C2_9ACTN|nr:hypothetical protein [Friedmanniella luteola]SDT40013.1 hypothetical protein SAMN04488543_4167 [Friedmanniella luteola]